MPMENIPEAMTENLGIMEGLLGPGSPAEVAPGGEWGEESDYPDPGLLTFLDELCPGQVLPCQGALALAWVPQDFGEQHSHHPGLGAAHAAGIKFIYF